jgi:hypothetical protein
VAGAVEQTRRAGRSPDNKSLHSPKRSPAYDWSEDAKTLKPITLLVYGDSDMFEPEHIVRFYQLLGGGLRAAGWDGAGMARHRLAILPGVTHYEMSDAPGLVDTALAFLEGAAKGGNPDMG